MHERTAQVVGEGPIDLVYAAGIWSNVDLMWDEPAWAHFLERLSSFCRLIVFDMRGVGLSDRGPERPTIELQRDDIAAVMDAVGIDGAVVFGGARAAAGGERSNGSWLQSQHVSVKGSETATKGLTRGFAPGHDS